MIGRNLNGRFDLLALLGTGGTAEVYRAYDIQADREVALKLIRVGTDRMNQKRFAREFQSISALNHPHCLKVYEFGETTDALFFTMELFVSERFTELHGQRLETIVTAFAQAASALDYIHRQGLVHRDIKPSNLLIRVDPIPRSELSAVQVKLADFGLARFSGQPSSITAKDGFCGTLEYCAPEQLAGDLIDHRADLYALGLVFYETLAGYYPYHDALRTGMQHLIQTRLTRAVPPLDTAGMRIPNEISQIIMAMLSREPVSRPVSATRVLNTILQSNPGIATVAQSESLETARQPFDQLLLVGRDKELGTLRTSLSRALSPFIHSTGEPTESPCIPVVVIAGEAGIGKSHLLSEVARLARRSGSNVYTGRCFQGNTAPYQPLVNVFREILLEERSSRIGYASDYVTEVGGSISNADTRVCDPAPAEGTRCQPTVGSLINDFSSELLVIAPELKRWLPGQAFRQIDPSRESQYILRSIATFLIESATLHSTCLLIEDLQWADQGTLELLATLAGGLRQRRDMSINRKASAARLLVCCTARREGPTSKYFLERIQRDGLADIIDLQVLSHEESGELVAKLLGVSKDGVSEDLVNNVKQRSGGNPFFLSQIVAAYQNESQLIKQGNLWTLSKESFNSTLWPLPIRKLLMRRLDLASAQAKQLAEFCSAIGRLVDFDFLRRAANTLHTEEFGDALDELNAARVLSVRGEGLQLEFTHDLLQELVYEDISTGRRASLHRHIAELLEEGRTNGKHCSPDQLARHWRLAGSADKAFDYLLEAAELALVTYAADDAIRYLDQASELIQSSEGLPRERRLTELTAKAYEHSGRAAEAVSLYERLIRSEPDDVARAQLYERIGELHWRTGRWEASLTALDDGLRAIGSARPIGSLAVTASIMRDFASYVLRYDKGSKGPPTIAQFGRNVVARRIYYHLTFFWCARNVLRATQANLRQLVLSSESGDCSAIADTHSRHAMFLGLFSLNTIAMKVANSALVAAKNARDRVVEANVVGTIGCIHYYGARLLQAESCLRKALAVLDRRGNGWYRMFMYHNLRHLYSVQGDAPGEKAAAATELQISRDIGDLEGTYYAEYGMANVLARTGDTAQALAFMRLAMEKASQPNIIAIPTALHTHAFVLLQIGDYSQAASLLEKARESIVGSFAFTDYVARTFPLLVEALLGPLWHQKSKPLAGSIITRSWKVARLARFWAHRFPNYQPHALRVSGRAAFCMGKKSLAGRYFNAAIDAATNLGARYDLARAHLDMAAAFSEERQHSDKTARELLASIGAVAPKAESL